MKEFKEASSILVLSPHPDDAVFSASTLLEHAGAAVWTVFAGVPNRGVSTPWDHANGFTDGADQMQARLAEDRLALMGVDHQQLPYLERAYVKPPQRSDDLNSLSTRLDAWLTEHPDGVLVAPAGSGIQISPMGGWMQEAMSGIKNSTPAPPLGASPTGSRINLSPCALATAWVSKAARPIRKVMHAEAQIRRRHAQRKGMVANEDHVQVRDVALEVANRRQTAIILYEEYPYAWSGRGINAVRACATRVERVAELIELRADRATKFTRMQAYRSQLGPMDPDLHRLEDPATIPTIERFWRLPVKSNDGEPAVRPLEVSVVIPTFNGQKVLPLQLEALAHQQDAPPFEVIVVDNGSSSDVRETVEPFAGQLRLRVLDASTHRGPSYARNTGVAAAVSEKIAFCDDDDCVSPDWVRAAADALDEVPFVTGVGVEYSSALFTNRHVIQARLAGDLAGQDPRLHSTPMMGDYPILLGGTCAIRRNTFIELGGFDLRFAPGAEDKEFARRYFETGASMMTAPRMALAVRLRPSARGTLKRTFHYASRYMLLCEVYGLTRTSPVLNRPDFRVDLLRGILALALSPFRPASSRADILNRLALRTGQVGGWVKYHVMKRIPAQQLGIGLAAADDRPPVP